MCTFKVELLRDMWIKSFSFDPFEDISVDTISKKKCVDCDLIYFDPEFYGDSALYENLCKFPWYYENDKWEFDIAVE